MTRLIASLVCASIVCVVTSCGGGSAPPTASTPTSPTGTCAFAISSVAITVAATAGPTQFTVTTTSACAWTAVSSQAFLAITSGTGGTGTGAVTFTVAANTGAQRAANITVGGQVVVVTQLSAPPPLTFVAPTPPAAVVGQAYNFSFAAAAGGVEPIRYQLETAGGFPPIGLVLAQNGTLSGTASIANPGATFSVCAVDATGRSVCSSVRMSVVQLGDDLVANWAGSIVLRAGCVTPLPFGYSWTGTITRTAAGLLQLEITIPLLGIDRDRLILTVNGSEMSFSEQYGPYTYRYVGQLSSDRRSVTGNFEGTNCGPAPGTQQSGTWSGAQR